MKRTKAKPTHTLNMKAIEHYRERAETYDLIQAVVPTVEKFGEGSWSMTLRGGGTRSVAIGHLFSGLTCEQKGDTSVPAIVRIPRVGVAKEKLIQKLAAMQASNIAPPVKKVNHYLEKKRKNLKDRILKARPHDVTPSGCDDIVVVGQPLFKWAKESSLEFFESLAAEDEQRGLAGEAIYTSMAAKQALSLGGHTQTPFGGGIAPGAEIDDQMDRIQENEACIRLLSPPDITLQAEQGVTTHTTFTVANNGTVSLTYMVNPMGKVWSRVAKETKDSETSLLLQSRDSTHSALVHNLHRAYTPFFCPKSTGKILPGEEVEIPFSFNSKCGSGVLTQDWQIETWPKSKSIAFNGTTLRSEFTEIAVRLHGLTINIDENHSRRNVFLDLISSRINETKQSDYLLDEKRRQRDPITNQVIDDRYRDFFLKINEKYINDLNGPVIGGKVPVYLTANRYQSFEGTALDSYKNATYVENILNKLIIDWEGAEDIMVETKELFDKDGRPDEAMIASNPILIQGNELLFLLVVLYLKLALPPIFVSTFL